MYFENCHTAEQCKARYRKLAVKLYKDCRARMRRNS
jgi:hypothetical protein